MDLINIFAESNGNDTYRLTHRYFTEKKNTLREVILAEGTSTPHVTVAVYIANRRRAAVVYLHMDDKVITLRLTKNGQITSRMVDGVPQNGHTVRDPRGRPKLK